jgi:hypothetical protein
MTNTRTQAESAAYAAGQDEMRERICALIHQHHYYVAVTYHGRHSEAAMLVKNILHDIREDHSSELPES